MEKFKKWWDGLPTWQRWAVVLVPVVAVILFAVARRGATAPAVAVQAPTSGTPADTSGGGPGSGVLVSLVNTVDKLAQNQQQLTAQTQSLASQVQNVTRVATAAASTVTTTADFIKGVGAHVDQVIAQVTPAGKGGVAGTHTGGEGTSGVGSAPATAGQQPNMQPVKLDVWVDHNQYAGYVQREVQVNKSDPFQTMIVANKEKYTAAEKAGDKTAMEQAHAENERLRALAKAEGVQLPDWALK